jgi:hypothetical protein
MVEAILVKADVYKNVRSTAKKLCIFKLGRTFAFDSLVEHWNLTRFCLLSRCLVQRVKLPGPSQNERGPQFLLDH